MIVQSYGEHGQASACASGLATPAGRHSMLEIGPR
jgi:hypothetical protein